MWVPDCGSSDGPNLFLMRTAEPGTGNLTTPQRSLKPLALIVHDIDIGKRKGVNFSDQW